MRARPRASSCPNDVFPAAVNRGMALHDDRDVVLLNADTLVTFHQASFIVWVSVTTIHVLGHILETPALAIADWHRSGRRSATGANARLLALGAALAIGLPLAVASLGWAHHWSRLHR